MKVLIAGGGTGGHLFPGIAVAEALQRLEPETEVHFAGSRRGLEARVLPEEGWPCTLIDVRGFSRRSLRAASAAALLLPRAAAQTFTLLRKIRPRVVVGTGGYASGPVVAAAAMLGTPTLILEQNQTPGITTRILARWTNEVHVSRTETAGRLPRARALKVTGNPVRASILGASREEGITEFGLDPTRRTLLVLGGSQGARSLNRIVLEALAASEETGWQCLLQSGTTDNRFTTEKANSLTFPTTVRSFITRIGPAYAVADLVISRAGATTAAELTAWGLPAIIVPYPWAAASHQAENAEWMAAAGAARVIHEGETAAATMRDTLAALMGDTDALRSMAEASRRLGRPEAAETVARAVLALGR